METTLYILGTLATVTGLIAAFLPSYNHKTPAVWVLFLSLILYALTLCLFLQNTIWKDEQVAKQGVQKEESSTPTPTPSPTSPVEQTSATQHAEPASFEPDEIDRMILVYLAQDGTEPYPSDIARHIKEKSNLRQTSEVEYHLNRLTKNRYIRLIKATASSPFARYKLEQKGREFLFQNKEQESQKEHAAKTEPPEPQPPKPQTAEPSSVFKPDETARKILALLDKPEYRNIYVVEIGNLLKLDHKLVERSLDQLTKEGIVEVATSGHSRVCNLTDKGKEFLNKPNYPIPHGDSLGLDEESKQILALLAQIDFAPMPHEIARKLNLHPVKVDYRLEQLESEFYIGHHDFFNRPPTYFLLQKGRKFVIDNNLLNKILPDNA